MNAATDELRRLIRAGMPSDGNLVPLYSAMHGAEVLVRGLDAPQGPEPYILAEGSPPQQWLSIQAFTNRQDAAAAGLQFDFDLVRMPLKLACQIAVHHGVDSVDIGCDGHGYRLCYTGMIDWSTMSLTIRMASGLNATRDRLGDTDVVVNSPLPTIGPG
jgi:hypothetical protein